MEDKEELTFRDRWSYNINGLKYIIVRRKFEIEALEDDIKEETNTQLKYDYERLLLVLKHDLEVMEKHYELLKGIYEDALAEKMMENDYYGK